MAWDAGEPTAFESVGAIGDDGILGRPRRGSLADSSSWAFSLDSWRFASGTLCRLVVVGMVTSVLSCDIEKGMSERTTNIRQTQLYISQVARNCLLMRPQLLQGCLLQEGRTPTLSASGLEA